MRFSVIALLFTATIAFALPTALEADKRAIECPSKAAANTACTRGRPEFSCGASYVCIIDGEEPETCKGTNIG